MLTSQAVTRTGMRNIYDGYEELFRERERELLRMANLTVAEIPPLSRNKPSINLQ